MSVYKDGILPGMWSWLTRTESGMVEIPENWEANASQKAALLIEASKHFLLAIIDSSSELPLKKQQLSAKVNTYIQFSSNYLKAILANDSNKIEMYSLKVKKSETEIIELWKNMQGFSRRFNGTRSSIFFSIQDARHDKKLS